MVLFFLLDSILVILACKLLPILLLGSCHWLVHKRHVLLIQFVLGISLVEFLKGSALDAAVGGACSSC